MRGILDYYRSEAAFCEDMALKTFELGLSDDWLRLAEGWLALLPLDQRPRLRVNEAPAQGPDAGLAAPMPGTSLKV